VDLRIIYIQDVIPVWSVTVVSLDPLTVSIVGSDFSSAETVLINRQSAPSFSIVSKTVIRAVVPESENVDTISEIAVLSSRFTATEASKVRVEIGDRSQYVSGLIRLMQRYLKLLLRNPGSDIFYSSLGGGLGRLVARHIQGGQDVTGADIALAVTRAERQLIQLQARNTRLRDEERLLSATLLGVDYVASAGSLVPKIEITSQSGASGVPWLEW